MDASDPKYNKHSDIDYERVADLIIEQSLPELTEPLVGVQDAYHKAKDSIVDTMKTVLEDPPPSTGPDLLEDVLTQGAVELGKSGESQLAQAIGQVMAEVHAVNQGRRVAALADTNTILVELRKRINKALLAIVGKPADEKAANADRKSVV